MHERAHNVASVYDAGVISVTLKLSTGWTGRALPVGTRPCRPPGLLWPCRLGGAMAAGTSRHARLSRPVPWRQGRRGATRLFRTVVPSAGWTPGVPGGAVPSAVTPRRPAPFDCPQSGDSIGVSVASARTGFSPAPVVERAWQTRSLRQVPTTGCGCPVSAPPGVSVASGTDVAGGPRRSGDGGA